MGKWNNRRWIPRRRYNNNKRYQDYDYEEPPPSPPSPHHSQSNPPGILFSFLNLIVMQDTSGSSWEIDFCKSVRVPWQKVVTTKKYMYCHENVVKWDDSAGEEAFHNAKRRYWEKINGLPCETPLPDQDVYIDEIDWNPNIDARLISDLDGEYFNPDETECAEKSESVTNNEGILDTEGDPGDNPWERGSSQRVDNQKGASSSWGQHYESIKLKNVNDPWKQSGSKAVEPLKNNAWKRRSDESLDWNQESNYNKQSSNANIIPQNSWSRGFDLGCGGEKRQRQDYWTRGWKQWTSSGHEPQRSGNAVITSLNNFASQTGAPWNRGWTNWEEKQLTRNDSGGHSFSSCRKRGGSFQHGPRYKASRFETNDHVMAYQWQREKSQKTVHFYV
ncbi:uncharacterized protein [Coffea arabica]|uniref:Uncharacterized protein isoform X1 n=1 Tax=Coffea arabica TaxID=13443 RepID=A0ABM4WJA8_COFAR